MIGRMLIENIYVVESFKYIFLTILYVTLIIGSDKFVSYIKSRKTNE